MLNCEMSCYYIRVYVSIVYICYTYFLLD